MLTPTCSSSPLTFSLVERRRGADEGDAAARDDAFLDRGAGRVQRVLDARLLLLHLDFGRRADADHRHAADQLRQPLLQLLAVVVRGGLLDLRADLLDAALDVAPSCRRRRRCVVLSLSTTMRLARPRSLSVTFSSLMPSSSAMTLPPVRMAMSSSMALRRSPKPGAFTADAVQRAADLVDHQRRQRLAFDVLGDDDERLAGAGDRLEHRQQVLHRADLLLVDQQVGILEHGLHLVRIGDEVRREVAAVELHALDHFERASRGSWPPRP